MFNRNKSLTDAIKKFDNETESEKNDNFGTVIEKVKHDNGWWILIKFDKETEPRWVHESKLSKIEEC